MKPTRGYYSLVQYCPDLSRLEAANVGVVLFRPEPHFIAARLSRGNDRVRRFFRGNQLDKAQIAALKASVRERLEVENDSFRSLEDLERFIAARANEIILTPPRPVKVFDPQEDLEKLYRRLVGGRSQADEQARPMRRVLAEAFRQAKVHDRIVEQVKVRVPDFRRELTVPFGFQNGRFNLIEPCRFVGMSPDAVVTRACRYAVEGESLLDNPDPQRGNLQLVIYGEFADTQQEEQDIAAGILRKNSVKLYTPDDLDQLLNEIQRTGKVVT